MHNRPTEAQFERVLEILKSKDPQFDLRIEFGRLLMIHIDDFSPQQRARYYELKSILKDPNYESRR